MRRKSLTTCLLVAVIAINISCLAQDSSPGGGEKYGNPERFEKEIRAFEEADKKQPPPQDGIVCIGSSSMRGWHETIKDDLAPLVIIPRGFGGSNMNDLLHYTDRIVLFYKPRAIVVYEGDNDIAQEISPKTIAETFRKFVKKVHAQLPECRIYFISIKPSISRWHLWPKMKEANGLIAAECSRDNRLTFVDVANPMLDDEGNPRKEIFADDKLHMNRNGYRIWRDLLKPILLGSELEYEKQGTTDSSKANEEAISKTDPRGDK
jgi:lysophospholipase L1-like esterase